jgi:hypothetical protein
MVRIKEPPANTIKNRMFGYGWGVLKQKRNNMSFQKIELGREVKCKVTGFKGIATSRVEYLNGCFRISVQPPVCKDGKFTDSIYIDEPQLDYTSNKKQVQGDDKSTGGPSSKSPLKLGKL